MVLSLWGLQLVPRSGSPGGVWSDRPGLPHRVRPREGAWPGIPERVWVWCPSQHGVCVPGISQEGRPWEGLEVSLPGFDLISLVTGWRVLGVGRRDNGGNTAQSWVRASR